MCFFYLGKSVKDLRVQFNAKKSSYSKYLPSSVTYIVTKLLTLIFFKIYWTKHQNEIGWHFYLFSLILHNHFFIWQIEIKILDALALRSPPLPNNVVLMSPHSEFQLKTNRDFAPGTSVTYSVVKTSQDLNASVATVDKNGLLVAGQVKCTRRHP